MKFSWNTISQRWLLASLFIVLALAIADRWVDRLYDSIRMQGDRKFYHWDARTLWRFRPFLDVEGNGRRMRTNSMGFRGVEEYELASPHDLRIVTLGDSRAYGMVVDDDFTFSHVLQNQLRSSGIDAEVINTGTPGYTIAQARGKLEQMLVYKPDIALLCVGYNDRRYLILTPPDSEEMFARTALMRNIADALQWSGLLYAAGYELGMRKLRNLQENPPSLEDIPVRVPAAAFRSEMEKLILLCRRQGIRLILMKLAQNPRVIGTPDQADRFYEAGRYQEAIDLLERESAQIDIAAAPYSHYIGGKCLRALGREAEAERCFHDHRPIGSLHGEAILRRQDRYLQIIDESGAREGAPVFDAKKAIEQVNERLHHADLRAYLDYFEKEKFTLADESEYISRENGRVVDLDNFYCARFVDECHYDKAGHILIGLGLADAIARGG